MDPVDVIFDSSLTLDRNNPTFVFPTEIKNIIGYSLLSAAVPFSYYVIDETNNTCVLTINDPTLKILNITIPPGTYSSNNFSTLFQQILNDEYTLLPVPVGVFTVLVDKTTCYLWISFDDVATTYSIQFNNENRWLGFDSEIHNSFIYSGLNPNLTIGDPVIESPWAVNFSGPEHMYLHSDISGMFQGSIQNFATNASDIIGFWNVPTNYKGIIRYLNPAPQNMYPITSTNLTRATFYLTIGNRTLFRNSKTNLQLEGESFSFVLRFFVANNIVLQGIHLNGASRLISDGLPNELRRNDRNCKKSLSQQRKRKGENSRFT